MPQRRFEPMIRPPPNGFFRVLLGAGRRVFLVEDRVEL